MNTNELSTKDFVKKVIDRLDARVGLLKSTRLGGSEKKESSEERVPLPSEEKGFFEKSAEFFSSKYNVTFLCLLAVCVFILAVCLYFIYRSFFITNEVKD